MKRYDSYKDSGVEWIGEVPSHWEVMRGKYLTRLIPGAPFDSDKFSYEDVYMPLIRIRDINNIETEVFYKGDYSKSSIVNNGDVLIGMDGDFNIAKWKGSVGLLNQRVCKLISTDNLLDSYAYYMLHLPLKSINDVTYSTTVKHLSTYDIFNAFLPKPTKNEQQAIASYLDKKCGEIDKVIETQQKRIGLLKELRQSVITRAVTRGINPDAPLKDSGVDWIGLVPEHWKVMKLKFIGSICSGDSINSETVLPSGEYEVYGGNGLMGFTDRYNIETPQIIIGRVGALCGNIHISKGKRFISDNALIFTCRKCMSMEYVAHFMVAADFNKLNTSSAQPLITGTKILNQSIPVPPLSEQQSIVTYIERETKSLDSAIDKAQRQIDLLTELKQSIITEVVTGKRKVC